jgi:hypothetical protein
MLYRVKSPIKKDRVSYEPGSEIELNDATAIKIAHAIEGPIEIEVLPEPVIYQPVIPEPVVEPDVIEPFAEIAAENSRQVEVMTEEIKGRYKRGVRKTTGKL